MSQISAGYSNVLGQFEIKKEVVCGLLESIKMYSSPGSDWPTDIVGQRPCSCTELLCAPLSFSELIN